MGTQYYFANYSPVGDVTVSAFCLTIFGLLFSSSIKRNRHTLLFINIVFYLALSAMLDIILHMVYRKVTDGNYLAVNVLRVAFHAMIFSNLLVYVVYIVSTFNLKGITKKIIMSFAAMLWSEVIIGDIVSVALGGGFRGDVASRDVKASGIFLAGYAAFLILIVYLTVVYGKLIYRRVMIGFYLTMFISFIILAAQGMCRQNSFTVVSFIPPTLAVFYLLHSTSIDARLGAGDVKSMEDTVDFLSYMKKEFYFISIHMRMTDLKEW